MSCVTRADIEAKLWKGSSKDIGIIRDVRCEDGSLNCEEFLPASHPSFDSFRCMTKEDMNKLIEQALRRCKENG